MSILILVIKVNYIGNVVFCRSINFPTSNVTVIGLIKCDGYSCSKGKSIQSSSKKRK